MTLDGDIVIQPLRSEDHPHWLPLWKDYQACYAVDIPPPVTALTWTRLLDPAEPVAGALGWQGQVAVGLVHHIRHRSCWTAGDYLSAGPLRHTGGASFGCRPQADRTRLCAGGARGLRAGLLAHA